MDCGMKEQANNEGQGTKFERETVIIFNEAEVKASIWTASESVYRQLIKRGYQPATDEERHATFDIPRREMMLPRPKRKREMSVKQQEALKRAAFTRKRHVNNEHGQSESVSEESFE